MPLSLLADLTGQIRCDFVSFEGLDSGRHALWFWQEIPIPADDGADEAWCEGWDRRHWSHYWDRKPSSYPIRTGDLRGVIKISDFYSARQWHSTVMYTDFDRLMGIEHCLMLSLPEAPGRTTGPDGPCGCTSAADPGRTSASVTGRCSCSRRQSCLSTRHGLGRPG